MKNYYYILGVNREATADEIKKAHRKLSLKFHPDQNQGDKFFEERFKELQEAYETLSNSDKRKVYHDNYDKFYFGYSKSKQNELNEKEKQLNALKSRLEAEKAALQTKETTLNNLIAQAEKERLLLKEQETILTNLAKQLENDKLLFTKKEKDLKIATAQIEKEKNVLQEKTKQFDLQKNHLDAEISALRSKEAELNSLISQAQTEKINALAKLQRNSQNAKRLHICYIGLIFLLIIAIIYQFFDKVDNTAENKNNIQPTPIKQDTNTIIANPIENPTFMLKNLNSNLYLEVKNNSNDNRAEIIQNIKTDKNSQKFVLVWAGQPNEFFIVNKGSKKVLSGQGGLGNSIIQFEKDNGERQIWIIQKNSDNTVTLKLRYSGRVADVSNGSRNAGAKVWEFEFNGSNAQRWVMEK